MTIISVYLTNLAKYNDGYLVGEWLDLPMEQEELDAAIRRIAGDDEMFITDYESKVGAKCDEYDSIWELNKAAAALVKATKDEEAKLAAVFEHEGVGLDKYEQIIDTMEHSTFYEGMDGAEYEEHIFTECYPDVKLENAGWFSNFITVDFEAAARDDDIYETEGGVLVLNY